MSKRSMSRPDILSRPHSRFHKRMSMRLSRFVAVLIAVVLGSGAAFADCVSQTSPQFTAGGNVLGRIAAQWNAYFATKVDSNNGTACNLTATGTLSLPNGSVTNAMLANPSLTLGSTPLTLGQTTTSVSGLTLNNPTINGLSVSTLGITVTNPQIDSNANDRRAVDFNCTTDSSTSNPNFSDENCQQIELTSLHGQLSYGGGTNAKKTFLALDLTGTNIGAGQRILQSENQTCYGMGDCAARTTFVTFAGADIAGDEG